MEERPQAPSESRTYDIALPVGSTPERALKNFRYVVGSVNESALQVWSELWQQLQGDAAPDDAALSHDRVSGESACGRPEFREKLWLMKHYLDYIHRMCRQEGRREVPPSGETIARDDFGSLPRPGKLEPLE